MLQPWIDYFKDKPLDISTLRRNINRFKQNTNNSNAQQTAKAALYKLFNKAVSNNVAISLQAEKYCRPGYAMQMLLKLNQHFVQFEAAPRQPTVMTLPR